MRKIWNSRLIWIFLLCSCFVHSFDYQIDDENSELALYLIDSQSSIEDLKTLHNGFKVAVSVSGIAWSVMTEPKNSSVMTWTTFVDGNVVQSDTIDLAADGFNPIQSIDVGEITSSGSGRRFVAVDLELNGVTTTVEGEYESFQSGVTIIPLIVILVLAATTHMVEVSLISGIFIGSCIVAGNLKFGFFNTLDTYLLGAIANEDHVYVYLFTFILSGLIGMIMKAGGFGGFGTTMSRFANTSVSGQITSYLSGLFIFFDDYANSLIVGQSMRPLTDMLNISREKLSFLVDATSAPVASLTPISSWIGFEIGLIQAELDKIAAIHEGENFRISLNGLTVFVESVKYRYYPIFMLLLIPLLAVSKRDFGPMLIAERKTHVYGRTDGGDGKSKGSDVTAKENQPEADTPQRIWNMMIPILLLVFLIIYLLIQSGVEPGTEQSVIDMLQNSNSYEALLYATMATALLTLILFHFQFKEDESRILPPTPHVLKRYILSWFKKGDEPVVKPLMTIKESVDSFLFGMGHVFGATVILTFAWASGSIMGAIGTDRFFADWIADDINPGSLPTLSFLVSFIMALATGTSWGTMAIMFPLLSVPTYNASGGDPIIFYSTLAGILSGSVAGDHASPISDTTVLSALASECQLLAHVVTQMPYAVAMALLSMLVGTLPVGYKAYPNEVAFLFGIIAILLFAFGVAKPILSKDGKFDFFTELYLRSKPSSPLHELKQDTAQAFESHDDGEKKGLLHFMSFTKGKPSDLDNEESNVNDITDKSDIASKQKNEEENLQEEA